MSWFGNKKGIHCDFCIIFQDIYSINVNIFLIFDSKQFTLLFCSLIYFFCKAFAVTNPVAASLWVPGTVVPIAWTNGEKFKGYRALFFLCPLMFIKFIFIDLVLD